VIERLNFYDVYGYLLPGVGLLAIVWLPFWIVTGYKLPAELSSALAVVFVGYVAGHAISRVSMLAFPHGHVEGKRRRFPSDVYLDESDQSIAPDIKKEIISAIAKRFSIQTQDEPDHDAADVDQRRRNAFMLCRRALLQHRVGSYAEQFEGLYALMRGWLVVAWLSATYNIGWAIAPGVSWILSSLKIPASYAEFLKPGIVAGALLAALGIAFIGVSIRDYRRERDARRERRQSDYDPLPFRFLAFGMVPLGLFLCLRNAPNGIASWDKIFGLLGVAAVSWLIGMRFHSAYHYFAGLFAQHVYRDFYVLERYDAKAVGAASEVS
jgi:hypothetical protein